MEMYKPTASYKLVYIYTIHDELHNGKLKVGKASFSSLKSEKQLTPNCYELLEAAKNRIKEQTKTALIENYEIFYTELAVRHIELEDGSDHCDVFEDHDVHEVLKNSGIYPIVFKDSGKDSEWFTTDLETIKQAIFTYKKGLSVIPKDENSSNNFVSKTKSVKETIVLRDEQSENVKKTISVFKTENTMLWDCKMRYGKTITAYELIRQMKLMKVIVVTHRPAVEDSWDSDHDKIFGGTNHRFIDKTKDFIDGYDSIIDSKNDKILSDMVSGNIPFTYFASMQDLRGSSCVGGQYNKNNGVFATAWDLIIIDEAHEGTQTDLGESVIKCLTKENTKIISLTGTAYGLLKDYGDNVFTWTYVDEQNAKKKWAELHPNEKNPYQDLPTMNILTFDLGDKIDKSYRFVTEDSAFNFREFFRTWTGDIERDYYPVPKGVSVGDFVYEDAVNSFLNLIAKNDDANNYPFSREEYVDMFKHTFWLVPGVKEARALSKLLKMHSVFKKYKVVNVAGEGDTEEQYDLALKKVRKAIELNDKTITISCGRLTTGITVKEWTAIMMLSGSAVTAVNGYMQAIFRVQSPGVINGKQKENCYVFDFAPDRALRVIGEVHKLSAKSGQGEEAQRVALGEFLNFCPVISVEGTEMHLYDVPDLMRQIKRISVESAINSGFDDNTIYLSDAGLSRDAIDAEILRKLSDVVAPKKKGQKDKNVFIAEGGLTSEERRKLEKTKKKSKKELTDEEIALLEKEKEQRKEQQKLFDLLRAVSIRLPLLFYGADADITEIIKLEDFVTLVDDESWEEFLPQGLKKDLFLAISKYYDKDVLVGAGLRIRKLAKAADEYPPTIRTAKIVEIISKFKNPDKETVLTPWRVVNMHLGDTLGGYVFFDDKYEKELEEPRFVEHLDITADILLNENVKILELNSKSGLYPLYMAYSLYKFILQGTERDNTFESLQKLWNGIIEKNIFVLCKTKMAKSITVRTLVGYSCAKVNAIYLTKLLERMQDIDRLSRKLTNPETWEKEGERMKFDAVVGNPPYQENLENRSEQPPVYHLFYDLAFKLSKRVSLISPARFLFNAGKTPKNWNDKILSDKHFKVVKYEANSKKIFPTVEIKGGVAITYRDESKNFGPIGVYVIDDRIKLVLEKVKNNCNTFIDTIIFSNTSYKYNSKLFKEHPEFKNRLSGGSLRYLSSSVFEKLPEIFYKVMPMDDYKYIKILGRQDGHRIEYFMNLNYLNPPINYNKYKVFIASSNGSGQFGETLSAPFLGEPFVGATETFLSFGSYEDKTQAINLIKYIKTKLARFLLGTLKVTQGNKNSNVWSNVPLQNFTDKSDIDWSKTIPEIDAQLYKKYNFTQEEMNFVESMIKPME